MATDFIGDGRIMVPDSTAVGGLKSISDENPQYQTGTLFHDVGNNKKYVYIYNAQTDDLAANTFEIIYQQEDTSTAGTLAATNWQTIAYDDVPGTKVYCVAPAAAIPTLYCGWVQVQGDNTAMVVTSQARATVGSGLSLTHGGQYTLAAAEPGQSKSMFAIVRVANTGASTAANVYLIGEKAEQL